MAKHIGIVACSAEGAALCFRTICTEAPARMGRYAHPEITMHAAPFDQYMAAIEANDWRRVAELMLASARKVAEAGADFAICPDNTIHQAFDLVEDRSPIPWLHIARVVADAAAAMGARCVGVLGTRWLMEGPVYPDAMGPHGIRVIIPGRADRERINAIIFEELVAGVFTEQSRWFFNKAIERLRTRGADAAVLGCTEIPLVVRPEEAALPTLDSTRLLAHAALAEAAS